MIDFLIVSVAILAQVCLSSAFVALDSIERFTSGAMLRLSILTFWVASSWASLDDAPIEGSLVVDDDCTHSDTCALNALQLKRCPFNFQHDVKETMLNMSAEIDSLNDKLVVLVAKAVRTSFKDHITALSQYSYTTVQSSFCIPAYTYLYISIHICTYLCVPIDIYTYLYISHSLSLSLSLSLSIYLSS